MFIIIYKNEEDINENLPVLDIKNSIIDANTFCENYINDYILIEKNSPLYKNILSIDFNVIKNENHFCVFKKIIQKENGYIYNSQNTINTKIFSLFISENNNTLPITNNLQNNIFIEINKKMLKNFNISDLYQIILEFNDKISFKSHWDNTEILNLQFEIINNYKKKLYSSVAKQLQRFGNPCLQYHNEFNNKNKY